jgi:hypothetical protein
MLMDGAVWASFVVVMGASGKSWGERAENWASAEQVEVASFCASRAGDV